MSQAGAALPGCVWAKTARLPAGSALGDSHAPRGVELSDPVSTCRDEVRATYVQPAGAIMGWSSHTICRRGHVPRQSDHVEGRFVRHKDEAMLSLPIVSSYTLIH